MNTIAIDCGASFIKGALIDNGKIIKTQKKSAPAVMDDTQIKAMVQMKSLFEMVREMILDLAEDDKKIKLCISNEMHGFLLADENGNCITDYISWQKEYGGIEIQGISSKELLIRDISKDDLFYTGMPLRSGLPSCNLLYLMRKKFFSEYEGEIYFYTLGDYLIRELAGRAICCHPTNAAAAGLFDLRTGDWNEQIIKYICEERKIVFPQIGTEKIVCTIEGKEFHIMPAVGDQQAALLGAGMESKKDISFNLGTGAQVSVLTDSLDREGLVQCRPFFNDMYLKSLPHLPSGRAINVYIRFIKDVLESFGVKKTDDEIWSTLLKQAENKTDSDLSFDLSFFENTLTEKLKGQISEIGEYDLSLANFGAGILDAMAFNFLKAASLVQPDNDLIERVLFSGGIAKKIDYIRKKILDKYGDAIYCIAEDETLIGLYKYGCME